MPDRPPEDDRLGRLYSKRRVLLTGHTGFKGGWTAIWLNRLGAHVHGIALPSDSPSLFEAAAVSGLVEHHIADITDPQALAEAIGGFEPELIIHMAAQAIVRTSFAAPVDTLATNIMGTAHLLEAARHMPTLRGIVVVTSDKCYRNSEGHWGYREIDPLGGNDLYSASKACAEIVTAAYRHSFFREPDSPAIATVRAGNVFGGGDWAADRIVPDIIRSALAGEPVRIRSPHSVRPWQHVLEPLAGYLEIGARMLSGEAGSDGAWNFGPDVENVVDVKRLAQLVRHIWGPGGPEFSFARDNADPPEHNLLRLDSTKARLQLGWRSRLPLEESVRMTVDWYRAWAAGSDMRSFTEQQIESYAAVPVGASVNSFIPNEVPACA